MKNKAIVFGVGNRSRIHQSMLSEKYEIIAFTDSYIRELDGKKVIPISEVAGLDFDTIIMGQSLFLCDSLIADPAA